MHYLGITEISARNALLTCFAEVNIFATSGSRTTTNSPSFIFVAKRLGLAFFYDQIYMSADISAELRGLLVGVFFMVLYCRISTKFKYECPT